MGIDRIGKQGPPAPDVRGSSGSTAPETPSRAFEVSRTGSSARSQGPVETGRAASPTSALERLRSGEIDLNGYVDQKVREATAHLGPLPPAQLDAIRSALRERMASDPTLVELVRTATGKSPEPPTEE